MAERNVTAERLFLLQNSSEYFCLEEMCHTKASYRAFSIVQAILCALNTVVHGFGLNLLISLHKDGHQTVHSILTINLSVAETFISFVTALMSITMNILSNDIIRNRSILKGCDSFYRNLVFNGLGNVWGYTMLYITLNKLVGIKFPMMHRVHVTKTKLKYLLIASWVFATLSFFRPYVFEIKWSETSYMSYINITGLTINCFVIIFTYLVIFKSLVESRRMMARNLPSSKKTLTLFQVFRRSRFYTSVFLIFTYVLFFLVPFALKNCLVFFNRYTEYTEYCNSVACSIGILSDAFIYTYVDGEVRKIMWKKLSNVAAFIVPKCLRFASSSVHPMADS